MTYGAISSHAFSGSWLTCTNVGPDGAITNPPSNPVFAASSRYHSARRESSFIGIIGSRSRAARRAAASTPPPIISVGCGCVYGFGVTVIVRPCHSNGSPVHAFSMTSTYSSRSLPRRLRSAPHISNSSGRYPAPATVQTRPLVAWSSTASCSASRTGSCSGTIDALEQQRDALGHARDHAGDGDRRGHASRRRARGARRRRRSPSPAGPPTRTARAPRCRCPRSTPDPSREPGSRGASRASAWRWSFCSEEGRSSG